MTSQLGIHNFLDLPAGVVDERVLNSKNEICFNINCPYSKLKNDKEDIKSRHNIKYRT